MNKITIDYRVYFNHPTINKNWEDVSASSYFEAESTIAAKYGLATHISAVPIQHILPDFY